VLFAHRRSRPFPPLADYRSPWPQSNDNGCSTATDEAGQAGPLARGKGQGAEVLLADPRFMLTPSSCLASKARHEDLHFAARRCELERGLHGGGRQRHHRRPRARTVPKQLPQPVQRSPANEQGDTLQVQGTQREKAPLRALILLPSRCARSTYMEP